MSIYTENNLIVQCFLSTILSVSLKFSKNRYIQKVPKLNSIFTLALLDSSVSKEKPAIWIDELALVLAF